MTIEQLKRQTEILRRNVLKSRTKSTIWQRCDDYREFDAFMSTTLPSNPWISDDATFWAIESTQCDTPTERRLKRWTLSIEELLSDPRGFQEFEIYLRKEYSHENILFWKAVQDLKKGSPSNIAQKVQAIFDEYLASGAACEVNLDSATMEYTMEAIKRPTRYTFENAQQHAFTLMQTDTYPRFLRSEHFNNLLQKAALIQIQGHRKRFFHFGASTRKKSANQDQRPSTPQQAGSSGASSQPSTTLQPNTGALVLYTKASGSTCDLRESLKRRGSRGKSGGSASGKTAIDTASDDDSTAAGSGQGSTSTAAFSGRHSHSTSDLHLMMPAHDASSNSGAGSSGHPAGHQHGHGHHHHHHSHGGHHNVQTACGQLAEKGESAFSSPSVSSEYIAVDAEVVVDESSVCGGTTLRVPRWSHKASDPGSMAIPSALLAVPSRSGSKDKDDNETDPEDHSNSA
ncbi:regulator of G-protein signaling 7-like [Tropilaelaps mercedesae]|uniref:Regulator of G-protein signaling 7-like n=1 Tax=Tropilaelaps mercedesae TaxID=418985 RepID=A0A1V9XJV8_9ACAR|nr:regulator of G-protein signaling 7-like [Tropilaelaps mercedesae]